MAPPAAARVVLIAAAALALSGCGGAEGDPHRFENLAHRVADIAVPMEQPGAAPDSARAGLRPAHMAPLTVQVMEPHDLWDARDGVVRDMARVAVAEVAAQVTSQVTSQATGLRPALPARAIAAGRTIQLGAFSTEAAAQAAWTRVSQGPAARMLAGLSPAFEAVEVNGRRFTRLKVGPIPAESAAALCVAAQVADPWCRRAG